MAGAAWLAGCASLGGQGPATHPSSPSEGGSDQPLRIGYLPITDASPLLIADALGYYKEEGLTAEPPRLFRSWALPSSSGRASRR